MDGFFQVAFDVKRLTKREQGDDEVGRVGVRLKLDGPLGARQHLHRAAVAEQPADLGDRRLHGVRTIGKPDPLVQDVKTGETLRQC